MSAGPPPGAVLHPADAAEVAEAVRAAARSGARLAVHRPAPAGAVELRLDRLSRILEIDTADLVARVEAGVPLAALSAALRERGVRFVPADSPQRHGSVGALYACGLGHARTLKYGAAKHFLLGSRMVLASGELLATGGRTVKNVTGYDLTRFFNAPCATFGVTVELTLKLLPRPPSRRSLRARLPSAPAVAALARRARDGVLPAYLLWADGAAQRLSGAPADHHLVQIELDGEVEEVRQGAAAVAALAREAGGAAEELPGPEAEGGPWVLPGAVLHDELKVEPGGVATFAEAFLAAARARGLDAGLQGRVAEGVLSVRLASGDDGAAAVALEVAAACGARLAGRWALAQGRRPDGPLADLERALGRRVDPGGVLRW